MIRRTLAVATLFFVMAAVAASPALAWGNGPTVNGVPGDGYGTHDWVLDHAIAAAGAKASWVDVRTALLATDDPDKSKTTSESYKHVFYASGHARGGPQAVADEYYALMQAYQAGKHTEASRRLGRLAHYYADICQPYHTDSRGSAYKGNTRHEPYEHAVYPLTKSFGSSRKWTTLRDRRSVSDVRAKAVSAAKYSRSKYAALDAAYAKTRSVMSGDAHVITGEALNRAINDLADIIAAVPDGKGVSRPPATLTQTWGNPRYRYPRATQKIRPNVVARDAAGDPMEGVAITYTWPLKDGPKTVVRYTDSTGLAYDWQEVGSVSLMKRRTLAVRSTTSGSTTNSSSWYMRTPVLADSTSGVKTTLNNTRPKKHTVVKARTKFTRKDGTPAPGLKVTFTWSHKSKTYTYTTYTNEKGMAYSSRNIGNAAYGYRVYVKAQAYSGGYRRYSRASFIPVR